MSSLPDDPVLVRRARIARAVTVGKRVGYTGLLGAVVAFVVAAATDFAEPWVTLSIIGLVVACVVLPLPIVFGYGLRAAVREERKQAQAARPPTEER